MTNAEHAHFLCEWLREFVATMQQLDATLRRLEAILQHPDTPDTKEPWR